jgi:plasmid stabilization system protein ParE
MKFEFHPDALAEYNEAGQYYASQQPGLDLQFVVCVEAAVYLILDDPYRWHPLDEDVRRCLTRKFPYGVFYTVEPDLVSIIAVAHCSRAPGYWKHRLD